MLDVWNKAVLYHFIHAIALFVLAVHSAANRGAWWLLFAGIFLFSGSLYVMALTNLRWLGAVTPLGAHAESIYETYEKSGHGGVDFSGIIHQIRHLTPK